MSSPTSGGPSEDPERRSVDEVNRARHQRQTKRLTIIALFVMVSFLVISYRTEVNARRIIKVQITTCESTRIIIRNFNEAQDRFIKLDRDNPIKGAERLQATRIKLLEQNKIPISTAPCP